MKDSGKREVREQGCSEGLERRGCHTLPRKCEPSKRCNSNLQPNRVIWTRESVYQYINRQKWNYIPWTFIKKILHAAPWWAALVVRVSFTSKITFYIKKNGVKKCKINKFPNFYIHKNLGIGSPQRNVFLL